MTSRLFYADERLPGPLEELSGVRLRRPVVSSDVGRQFPVGAIGTIVTVLRDGAAFIVEFAEPFSALVDVAAEDVEAVPGEARGDLVAGRLAHRTP